VLNTVAPLIRLTILLGSRGADIENEHVPPELYDADSVQGQTILQSSSSTPGPAAEPATPEVSDAGSAQEPAQRAPGHGRKASLGTTKTSPSTRRRSLENTLSLIHDALEAADGDGEKGGEDVEGVTGSGGGDEVYSK
jgi:serine/threonine-protein phosphatase 2B catalytic subunit